MAVAGVHGYLFLQYVKDLFENFLIHHVKALDDISLNFSRFPKAHFLGHGFIGDIYVWFHVFITGVPRALHDRGWGNT